MKRLSALLFVLLSATSFLAAQAAQSDTVVEEIIARVNNSIITRADVRRAREQLISEEKQDNPATADQDIKQREPDLLRDLIDQQLLLQKGQDLGINADTDVVKKLDELRTDACRFHGRHGEGGPGPGHLV